MVEEKKTQLLDARMQVEEGVKAKKRKSTEPTSPERTETANASAPEGGNTTTAVPTLPGDPPVPANGQLPPAANAQDQAAFPTSDVQMDGQPEVQATPPTQQKDPAQERADERKSEAADRIRKIREAAEAEDASAAARAAASAPAGIQ